MKYVWDLLAHPRSPGQDGYFEHKRSDLVDLLTTEPRRFVDVGCGTGLTGAEVKRRFPNAVVDGFEFNGEAAALAASRLDNVHHGDVGKLELSRLYAPESIDALLLADVLEHLSDPWDFLVRIRPLLTRNAQVIASIPNIRNLFFLEGLASGTFAYEPASLLDVTHIRFFSRADILRMFDETGYVVTEIGNVRDYRIADMSAETFPVNLETANLVIKAVTPEALAEYATIQFYIRAHPRAIEPDESTPIGGGNAT